MVIKTQEDRRRSTVFWAVSAVPSLLYFHKHRTFFLKIVRPKTSLYNPKEVTFSYGWTHHLKELVMRAVIGSILGFGVSVGLYGPYVEKHDAKTQ